jgi:hypothetical protein
VSLLAALHAYQDLVEDLGVGPDSAENKYCRTPPGGRDVNEELLGPSVHATPRAGKAEASE